MSQHVIETHQLVRLDSQVPADVLLPGRGLELQPLPPAHRFTVDFAVEERRWAIPRTRLRKITVGNREVMVILIILLVLALIFGVGSVLEGLAWGFLIVVALLVAAAVYGYKKLAG